MLVRLRLSASAENYIYQRQGIDSIYEWENFDKDDAIYLLRLVYKPSGSGNDEMFSFKADLNIQIAVFFVHHNICTRWIVYYGYITDPTIFTLKNNVR